MPAYSNIPCEQPKRIIAFVAIGHVASAVGSEIKQFLEQIMVHIKEGLQLHGYVPKPFFSGLTVDS